MHTYTNNNFSVLEISTLAQQCSPKSNSVSTTKKVLLQQHNEKKTLKLTKTERTSCKKNKKTTSYIDYMLAGKNGSLIVYKIKISDNPTHYFGHVSTHNSEKDFKPGDAEILFDQLDKLFNHHYTKE